ncbi:N-acetyl-gamma-glutamyl-phosphate reductase [Olivibacter sitiensis]|uniref:N-acetyl-gamma-glutamyl-phosphate reductase n=1 Tax=Olivibacter sitiensis TaxID=376470 RepID=UPI0004055198|nr:N-acetyl-gamma-glutamyl-phosphate reductase [Olivibacter sitiensis]
MQTIHVGIIGSAGYTGGELLRILVHHPHVQILFAHSASNADKPIHSVHTDLLGDTDLLFSSDFDLEKLAGQENPVLFLCVGHGDARKFLEANTIPSPIKIIDLSQDYRLSANTSYQGKDFVYGLPELNKEKIKSADYIANPGCFATNIQLALLPLAASKLLPKEVNINATTGSTGAGQKPGATSHFSWRNNNLSVYKAFNHQHLQEIGESLEQLQQGFLPNDRDSLLENAAERLLFIPQRGDFTRGIFSAIYLDCDKSLEEIETIYQDYYAEQPFTHISKTNIDLKQVVNTNKCFIHLEKHGNKLFITTIIDNLLKGASGQAVQNMNLVFGLGEATGLRLKGTAF